MIDADAIGHQVLRLPDVKQRLCDEFGREILAADGEIDRRRLGGLVFGTTPEQQAARRKLEQIVHPEIGRLISETISQERASHTIQASEVSHPSGAAVAEAVILDAAILLEAGWNDVCTAVVFVDSPLKTRQQRVHESRGWSGEDLRKREASQMGLDEKKSHADLIISNDSTLEHAGRQLEEFIDQLIAADE